MKYRIVGYDRFSYESYVHSTHLTLDSAKAIISALIANPNGSPGLCDVYHIEDELGGLVRTEERKEQNPVREEEQNPVVAIRRAYANRR